MLTSSYSVAALALVFGYLLGSIPFGMILTRLAGTQDLRSVGSGNIGATNVLRTGRKGLAAATLLGDMLKGTVAVILAGKFGGPNAAMLAALGAFLGGSASRVAKASRPISACCLACSGRARWHSAPCG